MSDENFSGEESVDVSEEVTSVEENYEGEEQLTSGSQEELEEQVQDAIEAGATEEEVKEMIKEFDLKVNGKSIKAKLDLSDEEAIKRELQKAYAFNEVSQKQAQTEKQLREILTAWKQNPAQALADLGFDPDEWAEIQIQRKIEELQKSPEQLEREKMQQELEAYKQREEEAMRRLQEIELQKQNEVAYQALEFEIQEAFVDHPTLKFNEYTQRRVADLMDYYSDKYPNITAKQVLPVLESELEKEISTILEGVPDKFIEKLIGKKTVERITSKIKKPVPKKKPITTSQIKKPTTSSVTQKEKPTKKRTFEELMSRRF